MTGPRVMTCNARKELPPAQAAKVVADVAGKADAIVWQEVETRGHERAINALGSEWLNLWPGGSANAVPISLRRSAFPSVRKRGVRRRVVRKVKTVDGQAGVTPDRWMVDVVAVDVTGRSWALLNTHFISQAFTSHPDRRPRWNTQARRFEKRAKNLARRWGRVAAGADANRNRWTPAGMVSHFATHGTYGDKFYDGIWTRGKVGATGRASRVPTPSDHDALVVPLAATK